MKLLAGPVALFFQIAGVLLEEIGDRAYQPGALPAFEAGMGEEFGVSRMAVRDAWDILKRERIVRGRHGADNFSNPYADGDDRYDKITGSVEVLPGCGQETRFKMILARAASPAANTRNMKTRDGPPGR